MHLIIGTSKISMRSFKTIYIAGINRSGGSLLARLFDNHTKILSYPIELGFPRNHQFFHIVENYTGIPQSIPTFDHKNKKDIFDQIEHFFSEIEVKFKKGNFNLKNLIFDPGFGYGKTPFQNLKILSNLEKIKKERVLLAGLSQKKFLRLLFETKENHLNEQSLTAGIIASLGGANILRVHQVKETVNLLRTVWPK